MPYPLPTPPVVFAATDLGFLLTLAVAFVAALVGGGIAVRLKQSPILGYLLAGMVIGPFTPGFVADPETAQHVADIGVILLLFGVGLHFSLGELIRLRVVAGVGGMAQIALTIAAGMLVGTLLGWPPLASFFLGCATAISSSAVLAKVLDERAESGTEHGAIALGWMIVQDLATIVLVVLLTGLSDAGGGGLGASIALALGKAALFVVALLAIGLKLLPWALARVARLNSRELFLVAIAIISLGTAYLAEEVGISLALGAFLAGLVLSESDLAHHILGEIEPTRDLFAVLFFVSIGMLVDPRVIAQALPAFLFIVVVIVVVKALVGFGAVRALRYPARTALFVGAGIAQAGEFSFLLARIGRDAGVLRADRFTVILGACTASIIVAPLLYRLTEGVAARFEERWVHQPLAPEAAANSPLHRGHIIVCGHGRVGTVVTRLLRLWSVPLVVIERDPTIVARLQGEGCPVVFGNAANPYVLDAAGVRRARGIVIALPEAFDARRTLDAARAAGHEMDIVVRAHSEGEQEILMRQGATEVVVAEEEMALEMAHHTLRALGTDERAISAVLAATRHDLPMPEDLVRPIPPPREDGPVRAPSA